MKASFNGLKVYVNGIYNVYNPSQEELESLKRHFGSKLKENNGTYTVYENVNKKILLELFVHEMWLVAYFDIKRDLIRLLGSSEISIEDVEKISKQFKERKLQLNVDYNWVSNTWSIVNYDEFLEMLKNVIADL